MVRGTQSLVHTLGFCWSRPSLLTIELAWRWIFGVPALGLLLWVCSRTLNQAALAPTGIYDLSLSDPAKAAVAISEAWRAVLPPLLNAAEWVAPLLAIGWAAASGVGRAFMLRRYDATLPFWPLTLIALQLLRIAALGAAFAGWFFALHWAARFALGNVGADSSFESNGEPNLVLYLTLVICISLGVFTLWALLSWVFSIAPLVALAERRSIAISLVRGLQLGRLAGRLVEVNLVLGIIKLALIVLAMVFSAVPLPFESAMSGTPLYLWWALVTLLYLAASDFFQVARLVAFLDLLNASESRRDAPLG